MNNPYDLHSWSKHYREEALREARVRAARRPGRSDEVAHPSGARAVPIWSSVLSLLGRTQLVE